MSVVLVELPPERFGELIPLHRDVGGTFPIIGAVLDGSQRGQVFATPERDAAFVVNGFGFARLIERGDDGFDDEPLGTWLTQAGPIQPSYILWYDPPRRWQARLNSFDNMRVRERLRYDFQPLNAAYIGEEEQVPERFQLRAVDATLLPKANKFGLALESRFWSSAEDFLARAMPVALLRDGEIASLCYAAAVAGGWAEVDVVTDDAFRGSGLGSLVARQFVRECLKRGLTPTWDCFTYNAGSMTLADKLGFVPLNTYDFYTFNIPVAPTGLNG